MTTPAAALHVIQPEPKPVRLDLGCGKNKREGYVGVDVLKFEGVDVVCDLGRGTWPWTDESIDEAFASHFIEHLHPPERIHFANELYRVLKKGGFAQIVTPYWASSRAFGDLTHVWPPVSEMWPFYLNAAWRKANAPHTDREFMPLGYTCDFDCAPPGYAPHPEVAFRSAETQRFWFTFYKEAVQDMNLRLIKNR